MSRLMTVIMGWVVMVIIIPVSAHAQSKDMPPVAVLFSRAPVEVVSQLPAYARLDMLDYYNSGSAVGTTNRLDAKFTIKSIEDNKLVYADNDSVITTIAVLPSAKSDTLLMVIRTIPLPMHDSAISFYDTSWRRLYSKRIVNPRIKDWLKDDKKLPKDDDSLPFMLTVADYDPASGELIIKNVTADFFTTAERPAILGDLKPELKYIWVPAKRTFKML